MKKFWLLLVIVLVIIQFIHPKKNLSATPSPNAIARAYAVPENVQHILSVSCNDCHSNNTVYPWYSKIQPVDWWLNHHVNEGKEELNFDEFAQYSPRRQYRKMEELIKEIKGDGMPLDSYTWIHKDALLDMNQKATLTSWAEGIRRQLEQKFPPDSLNRPQKKA